MIRSMSRFKSSSSKPRRTSNHPIQCKKHPKHRQSPGVCSLCLTEKLSRVSPTSFQQRYALSSRAKARAYYCSSSSISSSDDDDDDDDDDDYNYDYDHDHDHDIDEDDSSCESSPGSPVRRYHRRIVSDGRADHVDYYMNRTRSKRLFDKSRSMVAVHRNISNGNNIGLIRSRNEKKRVMAPNIVGFWSKLLGPRRSSQHINHNEMIYKSSTSMAVC